MAQALGLPVAALLKDATVLLEVQASDDTLRRVRREGRPAAKQVAAQIAQNIETLLLQEAGRPPVDLSPGARAKPRGAKKAAANTVAKPDWALITARREELQAERRRARVIAEDGGGRG